MGRDGDSPATLEPADSCYNPNFRYVFGMSVKEQVLQAIQRLPDDIDYRDVADEIAFLVAIREAERDIEEGRLITNQQMKARIAKWTGS